MGSLDRVAIRLVKEAVTGSDHVTGECCQPDPGCDSGYG